MFLPLQLPSPSHSSFSFHSSSHSLTCPLSPSSSFPLIFFSILLHFILHVSFFPSFPFPLYFPSSFLPSHLLPNSPLLVNGFSQTSWGGPQNKAAEQAHGLPSSSWVNSSFDWWKQPLWVSRWSNDYTVHNMHGILLSLSLSFPLSSFSSPLLHLPQTPSFLHPLLPIHLPSLPVFLDLLFSLPPLFSISHSLYLTPPKLALINLIATNCQTVSHRHLPSPTTSPQ